MTAPNPQKRLTNGHIAPNKETEPSNLMTQTFLRRFALILTSKTFTLDLCPALPCQPRCGVFRSCGSISIWLHIVVVGNSHLNYFKKLGLLGQGGRAAQKLGALAALAEGPKLSSTSFPELSGYQAYTCCTYVHGDKTLLRTKGNKWNFFCNSRLLENVL